MKRRRAVDVLTWSYMCPNPEVPAGGCWHPELWNTSFYRVHSWGSGSQENTEATSTAVSARGAGGPCRLRAAPDTSRVEPHATKSHPGVELCATKSHP